jgi:hypothetical protein
LCRKWELDARIWLWDLNWKSSRGKTKRSSRIKSSQRNGVKDSSVLNSFCIEPSGKLLWAGKWSFDFHERRELSCKIYYICSAILQYLSIFLITTNTHFANNFITWHLASTLNSGHHQAMTQKYECIQKVNTIILSHLRQKCF